MPAIDKTYVAGGVTEASWYSDYFKFRTLRERVSPSAADLSELLIQKLPPRSRVLWGTIKNVAAQGFTIGSSATATASNVANSLVISTASAMSTSVLAVSTGTGMQGALGFGTTGTASNAVGHFDGSVSQIGTNVSQVGTNAANVSSSPLYIYLVPCNVTTATNQTRFEVSAAGISYTANTTVDVTIHYLQAYDSPNA